MWCLLQGMILQLLLKVIADTGSPVDRNHWAVLAVSRDLRAVYFANFASKSVNFMTDGTIIIIWTEVHDCLSVIKGCMQKTVHCLWKNLLMSFPGGVHLLQLAGKFSMCRTSVESVCVFRALPWFRYIAFTFASGTIPGLCKPDELNIKSLVFFHFLF